VTGTHVVDSDADTQSLQGRDNLSGFGKILDWIALGYFQDRL